MSREEITFDFNFEHEYHNVRPNQIISGFSNFVIL